MAKKRKKYLVTKNSEAYACSLVTSPAVEELFISFNEDKPLVEKFADEKKHMITGVVAIPNKPIYRRNADGEEYDIVFTEEAIEEMAKDFLKEYRQHEVTLQHQEDAEGVYLVEQWIKSDEVYDKSLAIGLSRDLPVGSWIQTYYVDSNDVWQRIESGELRGLSLECLLGLEEFEKQIENNLTNNGNMNLAEDMNFWKKMKEVIREAFKKDEADNDMECQPTPSVEELSKESGFTNVEDYKKEVEAIREELEEETPTVETPTEATETPTEPSKDAEPTTTPTEENKASEEPENEPTEKDNHLEDILKSVKAEVEALRELNKDLTAKVKSLEKEPSTKPITTNSGKGNKGDTFDNWMTQMEKYYR